MSIAARPPPVDPSSRLQRWWRDTRRQPGTAVLGLIAVALLAALALVIVDWLLIAAAPPWGTAATCAEHRGACWPFWMEKGRFILFGTYPHALHWRPALVSAILLGLSVLTGQMVVGGRWRAGPLLAGLWLVGVVASFVLMGGGRLGLVPVDATRWNGLPVLLILSTVALALAFPLGVLLALARYQTRYRLIRRITGLHVEVMRGLPMVTLLFVGAFVLPLMLPRGVGISPVMAVLVALVFFHSAYFAEDIRAGLLALPAGQAEAAAALGLGFWRGVRLVLLPQALVRALPALVNSTIGAYKDTSLIVVVGLFDLDATARMAFAEIEWGRQAFEAYVFVGAWFLLSCSYLSWIGRRLGRRGAPPR